MSRTVLFIDDIPLLLSRVKRATDGSVKSGYVENGYWDLVIKDGELLAKDGRFIVTRHPVDVTNFREVVVPESVKGDYSDVISWAKTQEHTA